MQTNRLAVLPLAALLALAGCKSSTEAAPADGEDTFDANSLASYTPFADAGWHWSFQGGALVGTGPADQSVLIRNSLEMADGYVEAVSSRADDGGVVMRFRSADDYYLLAFRDDGAPEPRGLFNLALYHHVGGEYREIVRYDVSWPRGTTHTVRLRAEGPEFQIYFDGSLVDSVTPSPGLNDPAPYAGPGRFGVRYYGPDETWITRFDSFRWHIAD